jgi:peptidoglycan hydrolase-like protein with peptidoglycan-binding domain
MLEGGVAMGKSVRRFLYGAVAIAGAGAVALGQGAMAGAAQVNAGRNAVAAAAETTYTPPGKPLYFGERGAAVRSVQRRLAELHYYPGPVDGVFGQDTLEAAWAFREVQGLRVTVSNAAEPITTAFEQALIHPRQPYQLVPKGGADRVEINQNIQVLVLYRNDKPVLIAHVSTGGRYYYPCPGAPGATCGPAITPDGNYHARWFYRGWMTVPLGAVYNPVFFIGDGYAIHGETSVPWYSVSHGCVRLWMDIAAWFHNDLSIGGAHPTPIYIRGTGRPYPESN